MFSKIWSLVIWYVRPIMKWFLRKTTGLCELQRICYGEVSGAPRIISVEYSLNASRTKEIKEMVSYLNVAVSERGFIPSTERELLEYAVYIVIRVKKIKASIHTQFPTLFGKCVEQIWGYKQLVKDIETLRDTQYDNENSEHEKKLIELWELLMPDVKLTNRISKQWSEIGFQGDDPKTDFRGMGILGLDNLVYFSKEYTKTAQHVLTHSLHPTYYYAFAIVGINLTSMAYHLLTDGSLKIHIYNVSKTLPSVRLFHQFYCYLFYEFDKYWISSKPKNIMDFSRIYNEFELNIREALSNQSTVFKLNLSVDDV